MQYINIHVRRWFDKINGNSYFNYYISVSNGLDRVHFPAKYDINYGYGTQPFHDAMNHIKDLGYIPEECIIELFDSGYGLKRDMKNMNK